MPYVKKHCYVVYGTYKDDPEYPIGAEEEICFSESEALERLTSCVWITALKM